MAQKRWRQGEQGVQGQPDTLSETKHTQKSDPSRELVLTTDIALPKGFLAFLGV